MTTEERLEYFKNMWRRVRTLLCVFFVLLWLPLCSGLWLIIYQTGDAATKLIHLHETTPIIILRIEDLSNSLKGGLIYTFRVTAIPADKPSDRTMTLWAMGAIAKRLGTGERVSAILDDSNHLIAIEQMSSKEKEKSVSAFRLVFLMLLPIGLVAVFFPLYFPLWYMRSKRAVLYSKPVKGKITKIMHGFGVIGAIAEYTDSRGKLRRFDAPLARRPKLLVGDTVALFLDPRFPRLFGTILPASALEVTADD